MKKILCSLLLFFLPAITLADVICPDLTLLQKAAGFVTILGILKIFAILGGFACFGFLFSKWVKILISHFAKIPKEFYEGFAYLLSIALIIMGLFVSETNALWFGLPGCLMLALGLTITDSLHENIKSQSIFFGILFALYVPIAMLYGSVVLGFLAVVALMGMVGFSVWVFPLCYAVGFKDESALGKATGTAFAILSVFVAFRILNIHPPFISVFESGAFWLGSLVGYVGLLIASSRWYEARFPYVSMNILAIIAGFFAIIVGTLWDIAPLRGIGGTFFVLGAIEKPFEFPVRSLTTYAYIGLFVATMIGLGIFFAENNMALIEPYLLF